MLQSGLSEDEVAASSEYAPLLSGIKLERNPSRVSTKQHMLSRPPRVLALHLNRSTFSSAAAWGGASKNNRQVIFPELLDVSPFMLGGQISTDGRQGMDADPTVAKPRTKYRLCSLVVHYGGHSFGHYIAYRRVRDLWLRISDESVRRCTAQEALAENPFMLFYEQIHDPPQPTQDAQVIRRDGDSDSPIGLHTRIQPRIVHRWSAQPESARASPAPSVH